MCVCVCVSRRAGGDSAVFSSAWYQSQAAIPVCSSVPTSTAPTSFRGIYHVSFNGELRSPVLVLAASSRCSAKLPVVVGPLLRWFQLHVVVVVFPILLGVLICIRSLLLCLFHCKARFMIRNEAGGRPKLGMKPPSREEQLSEEEIQRMTEEVMAIYADRESSKDPFMSPGLAPANSLRGLPPVHIVVSQSHAHVLTHAAK